MDYEYLKILCVSASMRDKKARKDAKSQGKKTGV